MDIFSNLILKQKLDSVVFQEDYALYYSYDEQGHLIENIEKDWNFDNNIWHESFKYNYEYDDNLLIEETGFSKEDEMQDWGKSSKTEYSYDQNLLNLEVESRWDDNLEQWENSSQIEYFYKDGLLDYEVYSFWFKSESIWASSDKTEYFYDDDNQLIKTVSYTKKNDEWIPKNMTEMNRTDSMYVELSYNYDDADQWINSSKIVAPIDDFGNFTEQVLYEWNSVIVDWEPFVKLSLTYDNNYSFNDLILPFTSEENLGLFNHKLVKLEENDWEEELWLVSSEGNLHYSSIEISSTGNTPDEIAIVVPNPATNFIIFKTSSVQNLDLDIYNSNGQQIYSKSILSNQIVNMQSLENGFYFYQLTMGGDIKKGTFVKINK